MHCLLRITGSNPPSLPSTEKLQPLQRFIDIDHTLPPTSHFSFLKLFAGFKTKQTYLRIQKKNSLTLL